MKVNYTRVVTSQLLPEHSLPVLPVTNQITYYKNMKLVKVEKGQTSVGSSGRISNLPSSCRDLHPATMLKFMKTSSLWRQRTFQLYKIIT